jgi:hypothetical protein
MEGTQIGWNERRYGGARVHGVHSCTTGATHQWAGKQNSRCVNSRRQQARLTHLAGPAIATIVSCTNIASAITPQYRVRYASIVEEGAKRGRCIAPSLHWHELRFAPLSTPRNRCVFSAAICLPLVLLVEIPTHIAADAVVLPKLGLEEA